MFRPIHGHHQVDRYDQPDDGHELAETCRCMLIRIYFLHTTVVLLTTFNIYNVEGTAYVVSAQNPQLHNIYAF